MLERLANITQGNGISPLYKKTVTNYFNLWWSFKFIDYEPLMESEQALLLSDKGNRFNHSERPKWSRFLISQKLR